jgi:hypothetical protein
MSVEAGEPWGRQPGESSAAWAAFWEYVEQPYKRGLTRRSLRKCAEAVGKSNRLVFGWSDKYGWVERARDYDNHIARQETEAFKAEIKARRRRAGRISDQLTAAGLRKLQDLDLEKLDHKDAAKYLELALKFAAAFEALAPNEDKLNLNITSTDGSVSPPLEGLLKALKGDGAA